MKYLFALMFLLIITPCLADDPLPPPPLPHCGLWVNIYPNPIYVGWNEEEGQWISAGFSVSYGDSSNHSVICVIHMEYKIDGEWYIDEDSYKNVRESGMMFYESWDTCPNCEDVCLVAEVWCDGFPVGSYTYDIAHFYFVV